MRNLWTPWTVIRFLPVLKAFWLLVALVEVEGEVICDATRDVAGIACV